MTNITTRFAPSPTGYLHLGHAYSALFAAEKGNSMVLRIENIDPTRCKLEYEAAIFQDLKWLGLTWEEPVRRQSDNFGDYAKAIKMLDEKGLIYRCACTRKDIQDEIKNSGHAPHSPEGPEGPVYPGICRNKNVKNDGTPYSIRLNMEKALNTINNKDLYWHDHKLGKQLATPHIFGDIVLARKDTPVSYHLCVTYDDHLQNIDLVTRSTDLMFATHIHRLLQEILHLNVPEYHHHPILLDQDGQRLAKRNRSISIKHLREIEQKMPNDVLMLIDQCQKA